MSKTAHLVDIVFVVFSSRERCSVSAMGRKHTIRACFDNVKHVSVCESGI